MASAASTTQNDRIKAAKQRTELARLGLLDLSTKSRDQSLKEFAIHLAAIISIWQTRCQESNPLDFDIKINGCPISLFEILCLVPEEYQSHINIPDPRGTSTKTQTNHSWLNERIMNTLVQLSREPGHESVYFAPGITSNVRESIDQVTRFEFSRGWLDQQILNMAAGAAGDEWNPENIYTVPKTTTKLVFFFNYTEAHWMLLATDINEILWIHHWYNSSETRGENKYRGASWKAVSEQMPRLERLVMKASGLRCGSLTSGVKIRKSAQQVNSYDCGVISVYNAIEVLNERAPKTVVDAKELRLGYLKLIRDTVEGMDKQEDTQ